MYLKTCVDAFLSCWINLGSVVQRGGSERRYIKLLVSENKSEAVMACK